MTNRRTTSLIGATVLVALGFAGCGSSSSSSTSPTPAATGASTTPAAPAAGGVVKLSADPSGALKFNVSTLHAKAGAVTVEMTNPAASGSPHGIAVQGNGVDKDSKIVKPGAVTSVSVKLKAGTYSFYCPVPGHEAGGMKGTLIVA